MAETSRKSGWTRALAVGIACFLLGGLFVALWTTRAAAPPPYHQNLIDVSAVYYKNMSNAVVYCSPRILESSSQQFYAINIVDIFDINLRSMFYNKTWPTSMWLWEYEGSAVAFQRIVGPLAVNSTVGVYMVEITRLAFLEQTWVFPSGVTEVIPVAFDVSTPFIGYSIHWIAWQNDAWIEFDR